MDLLHDLGIGFDVAFAARNLLAALFGALLGLLAGVLPGIGPVAAVALLVPLLTGLDLTPALVLLAAVYCGAQYGTSIAAILVKGRSGPQSPAASADGVQMARQGRGAAALSAVTLGAFLAGAVGTLIVAALALPLAELAFRFGPAEYFSLVVLGLVGAAAFASGSFAKGLAMTLLGLLLAQVGGSSGTGTPRFAFDLAELSGGIGFAAMAIGLFCIAEAIGHVGAAPPRRELVTAEVRELRPTSHELREAWPAMWRGTALGSALGLLPGHGSLLASVVAYAVEKRAVDEPRVPFGRGAIEGVAGPESANSAAVRTSFAPMLVFGVPANAVMALMVGVMSLKGVHAGPQVLTGQPELFWGVVVSMWVANLILLALSLPLARAWIRLLRVPYAAVFAAILALSCLGAYALGHRTFDIWLVALVAVVGYGFIKLGCDTAPLLLGLVMEPVLEENLRNALRYSGGDWKALASRPLSSALLIAALLVIVAVALPSVRQKRDLALHED